MRDLLVPLLLMVGAVFAGIVALILPHLLIFWIREYAVFRAIRNWRKKWPD